MKRKSSGEALRLNCLLLRQFMETTKQVCFGSNSVEIVRLVNALATALDRSGLSLEFSPDTDAVHISWYSYGGAASWVHCTASPLTRDIARSVSATLGTELSLFEASCEVSEDQGNLSYQARTISADGKITPMESDALEGLNLESATAGYVRDRLAQILDMLKGCEGAPELSHSFIVFPVSDTPIEPSSRADSIRESRVAHVVSELESGASATFRRYDNDKYEFTIQTAAGYPSTIYVTVAEQAAIDEALTDAMKAKLVVPTVHGPLM